MARSSTRGIRLVTAVALLVSLSPANLASARLITTAEQTVSVAHVSVDAYALHDGISIRAQGLERDAKSIDVFRSTVEGERGDKLNVAPVAGIRYLDKSAKPGMQYFYTVEVAEWNDPDAATHASLTAALAQAKAPVVEAPQARHAVPDAPRVPGDDAVAVSDAPAGRVSGVAAASQVAPSGVTTLTANTTWSPSGGPYFVRNDLVVPSGKTLTILPGTMVYFDSAVSGNGAPGTSDNPTDRVDIVVHGRLVANGTSVAPIHFDSIRSLAPSAAAGPATPGEWGCVYTDSRAASSIVHAWIEFAVRGVHAYRTARPYVSYCTLRGIREQAIFFEDPVVDLATPRPQVISNNISAAGQGIVMEWSVEAADKGAKTLDPLVSKNTVNADPALSLRVFEEEAPVTRGAATLKGSVTGNTLSAPANVAVPGEAVFLDATSGGGYSALVSTVFSGNRIRNVGGLGVVATADAASAGAASTKPTFAADNISAASGSVYATARCLSGIQTVTAAAAVSPRFTKTTLKSEAQTVFLSAQNTGGGSAASEGSWFGGTVESNGGTAVDARADATWGAASVSPVLTGMRAASNESGNALYLDASSHHAATARVTPHITGGATLSQRSGAIVMYARSGEGDALVTPYITNGDIESYENAVYANAEASADSSGTGSANGSFTMLDTLAVSNAGTVVDSDVTARTSGSATLSPVITDSTLVAEGGDALRFLVDSAQGTPSCKPAVTRGTVRSSGSCLLIEAYRSGSDEAALGVAASPRLVDSVLESKNSTVLYIRGFNNCPGGASAKPYVRDCDVASDTGSSAIDIEVAAGATGTADVSPDIARTDISSDRDCAYLWASNFAPEGTARVGGVIVGTAMRSSWESAVDAWAQGVGSAEVRTALNSVAAQAPSAAAYNMVAISSGVASESARCAPVVSGGSVDSGNGTYFEAHANSGSTASAVAEPQVKNATVSAASDSAIHTFAFSEGTGPAINRSYIYNTATTSTGGISNEAYAVGDASDPSVGEARCEARVTGVSASSRMKVTASGGTGVTNSAASDGGASYNSSQSKYLDVVANGNGVRTGVSSNAPAAVAQSTAIIASNVISGDWLSRRSGIRSSIAGDAVIDRTLISANRVSDCARDGIQCEVSASSAATVQPTITGNTVIGAGENSIGLYDTGTAHSTAPFLLTKNTLSRAGWNNVFVGGLPAGTVEQNRMYTPGEDAAGPVAPACLYWDGASSTSKVRGNMFAGARAAAVWYTGAAAPVTTFNSFGDLNGVVNRPYNYATTAVASTTPAFDATYNWWGTTSASVIEAALFAPGFAGGKAELIDARYPLASCQARVTKVTVGRSGTKRTFKVYFDRPMDRTPTSLFLGRTPGARTYRVRGTWNVSGTSFTGTCSTALPTRVRLYFTGAKDLPGTAMLSSSRYVRL